MNTKTVIRGGRLLDAAAHTAAYNDILIEDDNIIEIGRPGLAAPDSALEISADGMLLHAGLVNAHTHSHGNLAKGMGDRWTLELLLAASPWYFGQRIFDDIYLSTMIGAVEMVTKGCTACYDLMLEMPAPTADGLEAAAHAYGDVGMRSVIAPMVADKTLYEAIPGLMDALTPGLRKDVERLRHELHGRLGRHKLIVRDPQCRGAMHELFGRHGIHSGLISCISFTPNDFA